MIEYIEDTPSYIGNVPELMSAQEIVFLAEDVMTEYNIQQIYTPEDLLLEVA